MKRDAVLSRLFIVATIGGIVPFGAVFWWGFELFTHFRVQYIAGCLFLAGLAFVVKKRAFAAALFVVAVLNARPLLPYLPSIIEPSQESVGAGFPFDVLTINVNAGNRDYSRIIETLRAADTDLVAIVELTPELERALPALADRYPHRFIASDNGNFGIGILSRYPLRTANEIATGPTSAIDSIVELPTGPVRLIAAHLYPPIGQGMAEIRNQQLDQLVRHANDTEERLIVCGDFNLSPYSPYFDRFAKAAGLRDVRLNRWPGFTWPSFFPPAGIPIDHCLIRGAVAVESLERLDRFGSDHYPVRVSLIWQEDE